MYKISRKSEVIKTFTLVSFLCAINVSICQGLKYEGESCQKLGLAGICRRVKDCAIAKEQIRETFRHDLLRCSFIGTEEVVCCPDLTFRNPKIETTTIDYSIIWTEKNRIDVKNDQSATSRVTEKTDTKRICEKMCEKIYTDNNILPKLNYNILHGEDAEIGEFPHMAAIGFKTEFNEIDWSKCAASLISSRFLLTAAHCFICQGCREDAVKIRLGVIDISVNESAQDRDIKNITIHQNYSYSSKLNDIALIEVVEKVQMSKTIYPACLHTSSKDPSGLMVTGWGLTDPNNQNSRSKILQIAKLAAVPITSCNDTLRSRQRYTSRVILDSQICAFSNGTDASTRQDACQGDSGAPLQIESRAGGYEIVGIVSYGDGCGATVPGIYTRVSAFLDWIEPYVWPT